MKNITHQKTNNNTVEKINRITTTFRRSKKANQARILERLRYEARFIQDLAVKNWLINFERTLKIIGGK